MKIGQKAKNHLRIYYRRLFLRYCVSNSQFIIGQKKNKNRDYYRCILFDQEITIIETKIGFTGIHLQNCNSKSDFFGEGHFHKSGGGHFAQASKKKILVYDIGFKANWMEL